MSDELCLLSAVDQARALRDGTCSARELVTAHLERIERIDPLVNAIVTRTPERALAAADEADRLRAWGGDLPKLHGLPIAHKDLQDTAGVRTTYGSPSYREHVPLADSLQVERLRTAGAIMRREDQHARVGRGLAHVQPGLRRDAQCVGREPLGRRLQRRRGGRPGLPHDPDRRRQRPRRLAAQPAGLERRTRPAADARGSCRAARRQRPGSRSQSRARWHAPPPISRSCSARWPVGMRATRSRSACSARRRHCAVRGRSAVAGAWPGARRWAVCPSIAPCATRWRRRSRCSAAVRP